MTRMAGVSIVSAVVALGTFGAGASGVGVTLDFQRPEPHPAVPLEARERIGYTTGRSLASDSIAPSQVHLAPTAPGEVTVVWATRRAFETGAAGSASVEYSSDGRKRDPVRASSTSYTSQLCVGNVNAFHPRMGTTPAVDGDALVRLANTSTWADSDAANYRVVHSLEDIFPSSVLNAAPYDKGVCLNYANPDAQYQSPIIYTARMKGLTSGARVEFKLPGESSKRSFTAPKISTKGGREVTKIAVVGDTGQTAVTREVLTHVSTNLGDSDVLLHTGDVSYADGFAPRWDSFGTLSEFVMSKIPTLTVPGNHDITQNGMDVLAYLTRYPSPHQSSHSPSQLFWSYEVGQAHIIGLNSYANTDISAFDAADSPQMEWLRQDLARINRDYTPWVIAVFHAPWYNSNHGHFKEAERMRIALEQTMYDAGVDLVLNGHVHSYERSHPVLDNQIDACGPVHIVIGDGGNYEGPYGNSWITPQPGFSAFREGSFGAGSFVIHNSTHATWEWRRTTCVANTTSDNTYFDKTGNPSTCRTIPDISAQAMEPVDVAVLTRDVTACPNKLAGNAEKVPRDSAPYQPDSKLTPLYTTIIVLLVLWIGTSAVLVRTSQQLKQLRTRMYRPNNLLSSYFGEDEFDDDYAEGSFGLKDMSSSR